MSGLQWNQSGAGNTNIAKNIRIDFVKLLEVIMLSVIHSLKQSIYREALDTYYLYFVFIRSSAKKKKTPVANSSIQVQYRPCQWCCLPVHLRDRRYHNLKL